MLTFVRLRNEKALPKSGVPNRIRNRWFLRHNPALDYKWYEVPPRNSRTVVLVVSVRQLVPSLSRQAFYPSVFILDKRRCPALWRESARVPHRRIEFQRSLSLPCIVSATRTILRSGGDVLRLPRLTHTMPIADRHSKRLFRNPMEGDEPSKQLAGQGR